MERYKPDYLGRIMPESKPELTDFMHNQYPAFSKVYDAVKDESSSITGVSTTEAVGNKLSVKIATDDETMGKISKKISEKKDSSVSIQGDTITATE